MGCSLCRPHPAKLMLLTLLLAWYFKWCFKSTGTVWLIRDGEGEAHLPVHKSPEILTLFRVDIKVKVQGF